MSTAKCLYHSSSQTATSHQDSVIDLDAAGTTPESGSAASEQEQMLVDAILERAPWNRGRHDVVI